MLNKTVNKLTLKFTYITTFAKVEKRAKEISKGQKEVWTARKGLKK